MRAEIIKQATTKHQIIYRMSGASDYLRGASINI